MQAIKITECPRDAMQGLHDFVPTKAKAEYINLLLKVGFDTIDFGSFVSPKAIPQMQDTAQVLEQLDLSASKSKLLTIVANFRGAVDAAAHQQITYLGYPFSISNTFQQRNTNMSTVQAFDTLKQMQELCVTNNKQLVVYLSMGFGNPYGDAWDEDIVLEWGQKLAVEGIKIIALADTVGTSTAAQIASLYPKLKAALSDTETGLHLHSTPNTWHEKIEAAYLAGCRRFDTAIRGYGGCPMAKDDLTGNIATEKVLSYFKEHKANTGLNMEAFNAAIEFSGKIFY